MTELPTERERTAAWQRELVRKYRAGEYLTKADKKAAKQLIEQGA
jgi:hypothetical protein